MTEQEWMDNVRHNQEKLEKLIQQWHPVSEPTYGDVTITAPNAERACEVIREKIRAEVSYNPLDEFRSAITANNWQQVNKLLNEAWFGVPESTDCWQLTGFKEAVHLMDDPPE